MRMIGKWLTKLGTWGPVLLVASMCAGAIMPGLAQQTVTFLPLAAFLLVLGSFLTAGLSPHDQCRPDRTVLAALLFAALAPPIAVTATLAVITVVPDLELAALIAALAPPTGSLAAMAAMLALRPRFALVLMLSLTLIAPVSMPLLMSALGLGGDGLGESMTWRLAIIIGAAAFIAAAPVRNRLTDAGLLPDTQAGVGVAILGLVLVGVTTGGAVMGLAQIPGQLPPMLLLAVGFNIVLTLLGILAFAHAGFATGLTVGLAASNRNVTLAWAAGASALPATAQGYLAVCVAQILVLPLLLKGLLAVAAALPLRRENQA